MHKVKQPVTGRKCIDQLNFFSKVKWLAHQSHLLLWSYRATLTAVRDCSDLLHLFEGCFQILFFFKQSMTAIHKATSLFTFWYILGHKGRTINLWPFLFLFLFLFSKTRVLGMQGGQPFPDSLCPLHYTSLQDLAPCSTQRVFSAQISFLSKGCWLSSLREMANDTGISVSDIHSKNQLYWRWSMYLWIMDSS